MTNTTKVAIKESIIRLLNRKPLNKITVKEIVDDCGINRNTFYYHYADIRALLEEIFIEQSNQLLRTVEGKSVYECLTTAISFALENKTAMLHIYDSPDREVLEPSAPPNARFRIIFHASPRRTACIPRTPKLLCSTTRA